MIGLYVAVVTLRRTSGITDDDINNVFTFVDSAATSDSDVANTLTTRLTNFYNVINSAAGKVTDYLSEALSRAAGNRIDYYFTDDFSGATPLGSPVETRSWVLASGSASTPIPSEVCAVVSFHGNLTDIPERDGSTRPASRRRGRVFIGPLEQTALVENAVTHEAELNPTCINVLKGAATDLMNLNDHLAWCVWSKADAAQHPVVGGYVDNAFDTQRRRGNKATTRSLF